MIKGKRNPGLKKLASIYEIDRTYINAETVTIEQKVDAFKFLNHFDDVMLVWYLAKNYSIEDIICDLHTMVYYSSMKNKEFYKIVRKIIDQFEKQDEEDRLDEEEDQFVINEPKQV